jgi:hypothetical protein
MREHDERGSNRDTGTSSSDESQACDNSRDHPRAAMPSPSRAANDTPEETSIILQNASGSKAGHLMFERAGEGWRCEEIVVNGRFHDSIPFLGGLSDGDVSSLHLDTVYTDATVRRLATAFLSMNLPDWACILGLE